MSVNKVTLLGNLVADPILKTFDNGGKLALFSVATSERAFKNSQGHEIPERTEFHNIVVKNKLAEVADRWLRKGHKIYLEGMLRHRSYQDSSGVNRYISEIHVTTFEMLTKSQQSNTTNQVAESSVDDDLPF